MSEPDPIVMRDLVDRLFDDMRETVKNRFGSRMTEPELRIVVSALAGAAGYYLAPFGKEALDAFEAEVAASYLQSKGRGGCWVIRKAGE